MIDCKPLEAGDRVAILAPASAVSAEYCIGAEKWLRSRGFEVMRYPSAHAGEDITEGSFSASVSQRRADMLSALTDPDVKGILCARGGYGAVHLLTPEIVEVFRRNPKWIIGFSDISAFHAMASCSGIKSIHSSMAKHFTLHPDDKVSNAIYDTLTTGFQTPIEYKGRGIPGEAQGRLTGGNFAVINALTGTPYDVLDPRRAAESILVLEDIAEPVYKIERMLYQLYLTGALMKFPGLIFGQFTEYKPDRNYDSMEDMIMERLQEWGYQGCVALRFPVGHVDENYPLIMGEKVRLKVDNEKVILEGIRE